MWKRGYYNWDVTTVFTCDMVEGVFLPPVLLLVHLLCLNPEGSQMEKVRLGLPGANIALCQAHHVPEERALNQHVQPPLPWN